MEVGSPGVGRCPPPGRHKTGHAVRTLICTCHNGCSEKVGDAAPDLLPHPATNRPHISQRSLLFVMQCTITHVGSSSLPTRPPFLPCHRKPSKLCHPILLPRRPTPQLLPRQLSSAAARPSPHTQLLPWSTATGEGQWCVIQLATLPSMNSARPPRVWLPTTTMEGPWREGFRRGGTGHAALL